MTLWADPKMQALEAQYGPVKLRRCKDAWEALASAVIYQQVAGKAAHAVCLRLKLDEDRFPPPRWFVERPTDVVRAFGMTARKAETLRTLAHRIESGALDLAVLAEKQPALIHHLLRHTPGVGPWTVDMWRVFHLGHEDVFMPGDLGLRKAIKEQYGLPDVPSADEAAKLAEQWAPRRTHASWLLWKSLPGFPEPGFGDD